MAEMRAIKFMFCKKLGDSHRDLAFCLGIPRQDRARWESGSECERILEWLEERERLHELQKALIAIDRENLVGLLQHFQSSDPLAPFFEVPPIETELQDCNSQDIVDFFRGYSDSWLPIQKGIALPRKLKQEGKDLLSLNEFIEKLLHDSTLKFIKIFGAGGSGKTTFSRMLAIELACHSSSPTVLLRHLVGNSELEQRSIPKDKVLDLARKSSAENKKLFLLYDNPIRSDRVSEVLSLIRSLRKENNAVVVVLEREAEWLAAYARAKGRTQRGEQTYFLEEQLRSDEINRLCRTIEKLQTQENIRILAGTRNISHFRENLLQGNQRVLFMAMYEATMGKKFEEIIANEFEGIPNEYAKRLYEFICGLTFYSIQFPYDIARVLHRTDRLKEIKRKHLAGIVRHRQGVLFPRHETIAEIVWRDRNPDCVMEMQTLTDFLIELEHGPGCRTGINLSRFALQIFELLTTDPKLQPMSLPYLSDIVRALAGTLEPPAIASLHARAGQYFEKQGERSKAIAHYERGTEKDPRPFLFTMLGQAWLKQGNASKAIDVLREGIQRAPDPAVYTALSQALLRQENGLKEAIAVLREGIQRAPGPQVYTALSQVLLRRENSLKEAIAVLREGIQRAPGPEVYTALSQALLRRENGLDDAIAVLREGIQRAPGPGVYTFLRKLLRLKGKADGLEDLVAALRTNFKRRNNLGEFYVLVGRNLKNVDLRAFVEAYFSDLVRSGEEEEFLAFARNLELHDHAALAIRLLDRVKTKSADLFRAYGNCAQSANNWEEAISYYLQAIEIAETDKDKAYIYNNLAMVVQKSRDRDRYPEAIEYCERAIQLNPGLQFPREHISFFRIEMSSLEEAKTLLSELKETYNVGQKGLRKILQEIEDDRKVKTWLELLDAQAKKT